MEEIVTFVEGQFQYTFVFTYLEGEDEAQVDILLQQYKKPSKREWLKELGKYERILEGDALVGEDCTICMSPYCTKEYKRVLPKCGHEFHKKCIDKWLWQAHSCPICREAYQ